MKTLLIVILSAGLEPITIQYNDEVDCHIAASQLLNQSKFVVEAFCIAGSVSQYR